ncbi:nitrate- and nitrite sensing domain-containing protein, partial [Caballeronia sp.]|uniref:nitrate- and nitrite sensing domain-containing protein n=1 Tax=Caballeronia sp. TaxID=1931223 RepID=UPI003C6FD9F8
MVLGAMTLILVAIPSTLYFYGTNAEIRLKQREMSGIPTERAVLKALQLTQKHRAEAAIWLSTANAGRNAAPRTAADADAAYDAISAAFRQFDRADPAVKQWASTLEAWQSLREKVANKSIDQRESLTAHATLIGKLLKTNALLFDHYGLSLDGDLDSSRLAISSLSDLPALTEELGKARAKGANILSRGSATPVDTVELTNLLERATERSASFKSSMDKATGQNPQLASLLNRPIDEAQSAASAALDLADKRIVNSKALDLAPIDYVNEYTNAIDLFFGVDAIAVDGLEVLLQQQSSRFRSIQLTVLAALLTIV